MNRNVDMGKNVTLKQRKNVKMVKDIGGGGSRTCYKDKNSGNRWRAKINSIHNNVVAAAVAGSRHRNSSDSMSHGNNESRAAYTNKDSDRDRVNNIGQVVSCHLQLLVNRTRWQVVVAEMGRGTVRTMQH